MESIYQVLPSDLFGCFKWPFQGLSDLHLGDQKDTWKKLVLCVFVALLIPCPYTFVYIRGFHQLPRQSLRAETGFSGSGTPGIEFVKPVAGQHPTNKALDSEHKSLTPN